MKNINEAILNWYDSNQRVLPWRDNKNPYYIWISEIMLQQTRVEAVIPYFNRFIQEVPTIEDLANTDIDKLNKLWQGLGYYSRVRNLQKAAQMILEKYDGVLPTTQKELESLPGICPYTSGAILSIAFNQKVAAVDGNVLRVFARLYRIKETIKDPAIKKKIKQLVYESLPTSRNGDYNQGIMEIGATICIPNGAPKCEECPLKGMCLAHINNETDLIPPKQPKKAKRLEEKVVFVFRCKDQYAIRKRPDKGLLSNLYELPLYDKTDPIVVSIKSQNKDIISLGSATHLFTHIKWEMEGYLIDVPVRDDSFIWVSRSEIESNYSIPSAFKQYMKFVK